MPSQDDYTAILVAGVAAVLLSKWAIDQIPNPFSAAAGASKDFFPALFGNRKGKYVEDQTYQIKQGLSPNPPTRTWWEEEYDGSLDEGGWITGQQRAPIPVQDPTGIPTAPVTEIRPRSGATIAGEKTHGWFTKKELYPWFWIADNL